MFGSMRSYNKLITYFLKIGSSKFCALYLRKHKLYVLTLRNSNVSIEWLQPDVSGKSKKNTIIDARKAAPGLGADIKESRQ
jgi:hypothetical protein